MNLREVILQPVATSEEARFQALMAAHHYLGAYSTPRWTVIPRQAGHLFQGKLDT